MKTIEINGKKYVPIIDFMKLTRMARVTVKSYIARGVIKAIVLGRKCWIDQSDFDKYIPA
ncbi:MAG: hypothetical protein BWY90_00124 [Deltaproteobacteria bacterium ADurb.BinA014]|nr:MAG: hypothetical protein BWY90_00124 [Deltaproteobacteria bacterium ADurb.BinA014]